MPPCDFASDRGANRQQGQRKGRRFTLMNADKAKKIRENQRASASSASDDRRRAVARAVSSQENDQNAKAQRFFLKISASYASLRLRVRPWCELSDRHSIRKAATHALSLVIVKAFAGFPAEVSGSNHTLQQRRRSKTLIAELLIHDLGHIKHSVQPDVVGEFQRTHRMASP